VDTNRRRAEEAEQARQHLEHTLRNLGTTSFAQPPSMGYAPGGGMAHTVSMSPKAPSHMSLPSLPSLSPTSHMPMSPPLSSRSAPIAMHAPLSGGPSPPIHDDHNVSMSSHSPVANRGAPILVHSPPHADAFSPPNHNGHLLSGPMMPPSLVSIPTHGMPSPPPVMPPHGHMPASPVLTPSAMPPAWGSPNKSRGGGGASSWQIVQQGGDLGMGRAVHIIEITQSPTIVRTASPVRQRSMSPPHRNQQPMRGATITSSPSSGYPPPQATMSQQQASGMLEWQVQKVTPRKMSLTSSPSQQLAFGSPLEHQQHQPAHRRATSIGLTITQTAPHYVLEVRAFCTTHAMFCDTYARTFDQASRRDDPGSLLPHPGCVPTSRRQKRHSNTALPFSFSLLRHELACSFALTHSSCICTVQVVHLIDVKGYVQGSPGYVLNEEVYEGDRLLRINGKITC
jgi:hypothetical protein